MGSPGAAQGAGRGRPCRGGDGWKRVTGSHGNTAVDGWEGGSYDVSQAARAGKGLERERWALRAGAWRLTRGGPTRAWVAHAHPEVKASWEHHMLPLGPCLAFLPLQLPFCVMFPSFRDQGRPPRSQGTSYTSDFPCSHIPEHVLYSPAHLSGSSYLGERD